MTSLIQRHQKALSKLIKEADISYLALFGSHARGEETSESDIDMLVEFSRPVGYFHLIETENKLSDLFNRKVDLVTKGGLSKYLKPYIEKDLTPIYERA